MNVTSVLLHVTAMHICTVAKDGDIGLFVNFSDIHGYQKMNVVF